MLTFVFPTFLLSRVLLFLGLRFLFRQNTPLSNPVRKEGGGHIYESLNVPILPRKQNAGFGMVDLITSLRILEERSGSPGVLCCA